MLNIQQKSTYLKRLVLIMVLFTLVICIPYATTVYNTAKSKVLSTIRNANEQSLQQIKYNYTIYDDTMSNLCMSIYLNNGNQGLLYNSNISYSESYKQMRDIKDTVIAIYPAVYSVSIYNGSRNELYSTLENQIGYLNNTADFIQNVQDIPKLQPILRRIPYAGTDNYIYVFSYYIYDYTDEDNKPVSYVVLEENANWLINNFTMVSYLNTEIPNRIYLVDKDNQICSESEVPEADQKLIMKNTPSDLDMKNESDSVYYTDSVNGRKYLITRLMLNKWGDSLVMIQEYDQVFAELISLQKSFRIIIVIWTLIYIMAIFLITQSLYRPVDKLVKFINGLGDKNKVVSHVNEFSQLMELYKDAHEKLSDKDKAKQYFMRRYQFEKLLTDEGDSVWKGICSYFPDHWLVTAEEYTLRVLNLMLQTEGDQVTEEDRSLYLFIIQNILTELMEKEYQAEIFQMGDNGICGIVQASEGAADVILESILQETQQYAERFANITFCVAYSDVTQNPERLNALYRQTEYLLQYSFVYGRCSIINSQLCMKNMKNEDTTYPEGLEKKLLSEVKCGNVENARRLTEEIFDDIGNLQYENIHTSIMTLMNHLYFTVKELYHVKGKPAKFQFDEIYGMVTASRYLDEAETYFEEYIESALRILNEKNEADKGQAFVLNVQAYVDENYSDPNLSSHSVGDHLGLTGKYVMKKFQDYTGSSLNDYIYMVRMRKAAQLLTSSNIPIGKVAEQVGILNENYFYKLFKKAYGCTPREFSSQKGMDR